MPSPGRARARARRSYDLHRERDGLAAAEAQRDDAASLAPRAQRVQQRHQEARARCADRMPERDGAAVHVELLLGDPELAAHALDGTESFVHLEEVDRVDRPSGALEDAA